MIFGLAHCITPAYCAIAAVMGAYLGWLLDATGSRNLLVPVISHALYDYVAFLWIAREYRQQSRTL